MQVFIADVPNPILPMSEADMVAAEVGVAPLAGIWQDGDRWHVDGMTPILGAIVGPALWKDEVPVDAVRIEITENGVAVGPVATGIVGHA